MTLSQNIQNKISAFPVGILFTYDDFSNIEGSFSALAKTLDRLSDKGEIERFMKGVYYKPKDTVFGKLEPSENEKIRFITSKGGYITGGVIYNKLGLTTQIPNEIVIATERPRKAINLNGLQVRFVKGFQPDKKSDIEKLQLLDVLKNVKSIPDRDDNTFISIIKNILSRYNPKDLKQLVSFSLKYNPSTRALLGAVLDLINKSADSKKIKSSLNPLSIYKLYIDKNALPNKRDWQII